MSSSPGAADVGDLQVVREHRVAAGVGEDAERGAHQRRGHDGEAVEPVGEVHRVAHADDHEVGERDEAEGRQRQLEVLHERQKQRGLGRLGGGVIEGRRGRQSGHRLPDVLPARREPAGVAHHELQVIVVEADQPEGEGDAEHHPHQAACQLRPQQRAHERGDQDQRAAHGRRAGLEQVGRRAVVAHHLTDLVARQARDHRGTDEQRQPERGGGRENGAEREVRKHVQAADVAGELLCDPVQH